MLSDLKACQSRIGFSHLLRIKAQELSFVLYKMPAAVKYQNFCISKKNGVSRSILAPCSRLKWIQKELLTLFYAVEDEVSPKGQKKTNLDFGFLREKSIFDNANIHKGKKYVLNIDIENYFDQFNFGRVRGYFIKDRNFGLHPNVATTIAQIACFSNILPQGSPVSPYISNLLTRFFDLRMARFLRSRRCSYSRYADDITISTNLRDFPEDVATVDPTSPRNWILSDALTGIFLRADLPINSKKTRMSSRDSRQLVTGLVVNRRPNVTREVYIHTRAMCHSLFRTGAFTVPQFTMSFADNCPPAKPGEPRSIRNANPMAVLEGRLSFIHYIREKTDLRTIQEKQDTPTQFWSTLQKFYIFKYFVGNRTVTILTEGPSDIFYLRAAILRSVSATIPELKRTVGGTPEIIPSFFRFDSVAAGVIGLTGGSGNIKRFLYLFNLTKRDFNQSLRDNPVIIVIDNDTGGRDVLAQVNGMFKKSINTSDHQIVHKITNGLSLVKTPHVGTKQLTCIEDLLPSAVKSVVIDGRTFSPDKKPDPSKHFGKITLAKYVRDNAGSIDLSGFDGILQGMNDAISTSSL
jgi:RNA-directed DNA polymerase